jgi:hypothetical protein
MSHFWPVTQCTYWHYNVKQQKLVGDAELMIQMNQQVLFYCMVDVVIKLVVIVTEVKMWPIN